ncbi:MAG: ATP-dependent helicase, partial [Candidatus Nanoarchaeia archaeon]
MSKMPLNKQQQQAVEKTEGPCVILAGAGTGKSFTMVEKINHLVNETKQYDPEEILCLTFSNEATNSLKNKIQDRLKTPKNVSVHTFHGFCADVLREDGHLIKVDEGFEILLPDDAKVLMHKYLDVSPYWCNRYITTIQSAKDFGITLNDIKEYYEKAREKVLSLTKGDDIEAFEKEQRARLQTLHLKPNGTKEERKEIRDEKKQIKEFLQAYDEYVKFNGFIEAWEGYNKLKQEMNYLDFSDLNLLALQLFRQFGAQKYTESFKYLVVDEFQDTNKLQFELIEHIASHHNITVVGDPNQAIYGFRGAYKESFENFKAVFNINKDDVIFLDKSYRSKNKIL